MLLSHLEAVGISCSSNPLLCWLPDPSAGFINLCSTHSQTQQLVYLMFSFPDSPDAFDELLVSRLLDLPDSLADLLVFRFPDPQMHYLICWQPNSLIIQKALLACCPLPLKLASLTCRYPDPLILPSLLMTSVQMVFIQTMRSVCGFHNIPGNFMHHESTS